MKKRTSQGVAITTSGPNTGTGLLDTPPKSDRFQDYIDNGYPPEDDSDEEEAIALNKRK